MGGVGREGVWAGGWTKPHPPFNGTRLTAKPCAPFNGMRLTALPGRQPLTRPTRLRRARHVLRHVPDASPNECLSGWMFAKTGVTCPGRQGRRRSPRGSIAWAWHGHHQGRRGRRKRQGSRARARQHPRGRRRPPRGSRAWAGQLQGRRRSPSGSSAWAAAWAWQQLQGRRRSPRGSSAWAQQWCQGCLRCLREGRRSPRGNRARRQWCLRRRRSRAAKRFRSRAAKRRRSRPAKHLCLTVCSPFCVGVLPTTGLSTLLAFAALARSPGAALLGARLLHGRRLHALWCPQRTIA